MPATMKNTPAINSAGAGTALRRATTATSAIIAMGVVYSAYGRNAYGTCNNWEVAAHATSRKTTEPYGPGSSSRRQPPHRATSGSSTGRPRIISAVDAAENWS